MKNYYNCIYMYTNKINGKRYIGQAKDFNNRHRRHINSSHDSNRKRDYNTPFHRAIRKYGIENFEIKILAHDVPTQEKLNEYKIFFIKRYNTLVKNNKGYNYALSGNGGNQTLACKTEEEMKDIRKRQKESVIKTTRSEEHRKAISEARKGINSPNCKPVLQYTKDGKFIKRYDYIKQASEELGLNDWLITKCCKGRQKTCGGFVWKYEEKE